MRRRVGLATVMFFAALAPAGTWAETAETRRSGGAQALYTGLAVVANVTPVVSALYAPRCLVGYVFCKALFAGISVVAAADQIILSGGQDFDQTKGILYRGFTGDWYLTARHTSREVSPAVLPDPPPAPATKGGWEPPPI